MALNNARRTVTITRPGSGGPAGDPVGTAAAVATLTCLIDHKSRQVAAEQGDAITFAATLYTRDAAASAVVEGDLAAWDGLEAREVIGADPWHRLTSPAGQVRGYVIEVA